MGLRAVSSTSTTRCAIPLVLVLSEPERRSIEFAPSILSSMSISSVIVPWSHGRCGESPLSWRSSDFPSSSG
jgi:hypothetical protein